VRQSQGAWALLAWARLAPHGSRPADSAGQPAPVLPLTGVVVLRVSVRLAGGRGAAHGRAASHAGFVGGRAGQAHKRGAAGGHQTRRHAHVVRGELSGCRALPKPCPVRTWRLPSRRAEDQHTCRTFPSPCVFVPTGHVPAAGGREAPTAIGEWRSLRA
jgi:hypothetical protein